MTTTTIRRPSRRTLVLAATGSALALAATGAPAGPALAEDQAPPPDPSTALRDALADHPALVGPKDSVSIDPSDGSATVELSGGASAEIALPFADVEPAGRLDANTALFVDEETDTTAAVQPLLTNGVRMLLTMGSDASPTRYEFDLGADAPVVLSLGPDGGVQISDRDGGDLGVVAAPWAQDANGAPVPTHYEIEGTHLVQVVEHQGAAHPVVADPSYQGDCGYVTCTVRFNRAKTLEASKTAQFLSLIGTACSALGPAAGVPCGLAATAEALYISYQAGEYYDDGDCLKIKVSPGAVTAWPQRLEHGDYNCTDK